MRFLSKRLRSLGAPSVLPSLYDLYPHAGSATRRNRGLQIVPVDRIIGTTRHPSQVTEDFLPLPELRGQNWRARSQRIRRAIDTLQILPPVDLLKVGDDYFVSDGHNRVAAARAAGMVGIDADVTELVLPGVSADPVTPSLPSVLSDAQALRQAGEGRRSRTVVQRPESDQLTREGLLDARGEDA